MITERVGDLLEQKDLTHIAHQCNLFHCFGGGLAAQIKKKYPRAAKVDKMRTAYGDANKLGTYTVAEPQSGVSFIINLYTQGPVSEDFDDRNEVLTDYRAMRKALKTLEKGLRLYQDKEVLLGLPWGLGCGIAGGSWPKVYGIIEDVFGKSPVEVVICRRAEDL